MKNSPYLDKPLRSEAEARGESVNHAATPGPWLDGKPNLTDGPSTESGSHIIYAGNREIARVYGDKGLPVRANARLIAAAPETAQERDRLKALNAELVAVLQAALMPFRESVRNPSGTMVGEPEWCSEARAVLAKTKTD